jgi:hypothetical protein
MCRCLRRDNRRPRSRTASPASTFSQPPNAACPTSPQKGHSRKRAPHPHGRLPWIARSHRKPSSPIGTNPGTPASRRESSVAPFCPVPPISRIVVSLVSFDPSSPCLVVFPHRFPGTARRVHSPRCQHSSRAWVRRALQGPRCRHSGWRPAQERPSESPSSAASRLQPVVCGVRGLRVVRAATFGRAGHDVTFIAAKDETGRAIEPLTDG